MTIEEKIDSLIERAQSKVSQRKRKQKIELYAAGLKEKLREAKFSLTNLREYKGQADATISDTEIYGIGDKVHFFCDCFMVFLYASLDVLAQIINQTEKFDDDERNVYFNSIVEKTQLTNSNLRSCLYNIKKSRAFTNLNKYRNCSLHRRHIYFEEESISVKGSEGYGKSTTDRSISETERYLCDDPFTHTPRITQRREVVSYCEKTYNKISTLLGKVLDIILA